MEKRGCTCTVGIINLLILTYTTITWFINIIRFLTCDFSAPWKEEIITGLGILIPPLTWVSVWMPL